MWRLLKKLFQKKPESPRKFVTFHFPRSPEPFREFKVIQETLATYLLQGPIEVLGERFQDWEQRVPKSHPGIVETYIR